MTRTRTLVALAETARDGDATADDAAAAAALLPSFRDPIDRYDALFVIGKAGITRHEDLVESYLDSPDDPMLARLAIQILCNWWGVSAHATHLASGSSWSACLGTSSRAATRGRLRCPARA